ncbi:unnamed protein product [Knipowitschia caucasica]
MPREPPCSPADTSSSASSIENATDQNSPHRPDETRKSGSEKDSGYSDTSSELKPKKDRSSKKSRETSDDFPQKEPHKNGNHGNVVVAPPTGQLPTFYIIKNMVAEQPHIVQKNPVLWSSQSYPSGSGSNPVLQLQPPNTTSTAQPQTPGASKAISTGKPETTAFLPILNSFPRIAPHPYKKPPDKTTPADSLNQSKRVCIESNNTQTNKSLQGQRIPVICSSSSGASSNYGTASTPRLPSSTTLDKTSVANPRQSCFINTVQVLKQSGLLDIALRTKRLASESNVSARDVTQLRQHSESLCQLASSSKQNTSNMASWLDLHRIMSDSGNYPELKDVQALQGQSAGPNVSVVKPLSLIGGVSDGTMAAEKPSSPKQMDGSRESDSSTDSD